MGKSTISTGPFSMSHFCMFTRSGKFQKHQCRLGFLLGRAFPKHLHDVTRAVAPDEELTGGGEKHHPYDEQWWLMVN